MKHLIEIIKKKFSMQYTIRTILSFEDQHSLAVNSQRIVHKEKSMRSKTYCSACRRKVFWYSLTVF